MNLSLCPPFLWAIRNALFLNAPLLVSSPRWWIYCWEITHTCTLEVWFLQYHPQWCTLQCNPTCQRAAAQTAPCLLYPAWGGMRHCRVISSIGKTGLAAAASLTKSLNSDFSSSFILPLTSHLVVHCLLFKSMDWSSFFFMCKSLSSADTLMGVLVVSFTPQFFTRIFLPSLFLP